MKHFNKENIILKKFLQPVKEFHVINKSQFPRITIVTPSFNQGPYLERTILSVLNQQYPNLQYIIMDGASTDHSTKIIKRYEKYLYFWQSKPDKGQSDAIDNGFEMADGEILAYLNSDDIYWPGALNFIGEYFLKHPDVDVVFGNSYIIDEKDTILREKRSVKFSKLGLLTGSFDLHQASIFWTKSVYDKVSGLDKSLHLTMDRDLWLRFLKNGAQFHYVSQTLSCYRHHQETKSFTQMQAMKEEYNRIMIRNFNMDMNKIRFKLLRKMMRLRTLFLHLLTGNISYLWTSAGRNYYYIKNMKSIE